jgi:hypothetical protein
MNLKRAITGLTPGWQGLSAHETLASVADALQPVEQVHGAVDAERERRLFQVIVFERKTPPLRIEAWMPAGQAQVILVEYDDPPVQDLDGLLGAAGPPEWVLEYKRFRPEGLVTEYVYASRGLTLSMLRPDAWSKLSARKVVHVQLYRPMPVEEYLTTIGADASLVPTRGETANKLKEVLAGRLLGWQGLSGSETLATLTEALQPLQQVKDPVPGERLSHRFQLTVFERPAPPQHVESWVLYGQEHVTLIEYDDPPAQDLVGALEAFEPPELTLENKRTAAGAAVREYVYAHRGLTLSVAEPYAWSGQRGLTAVHLQLYRAGSAEYYLSYIGTGPEIRPVPRRLVLYRGS